MRTRTSLLHRRAIQAITSAATVMLTAGISYADPFFFSTGIPDGSMATASRPATAGKFEIESADDFALTSPTALTSATFVGLLTGGATVGEIRVEFYRVFPKDSDVGRTSGPPKFSTPQVPTRVNSPSDVEFVDRDTADGNLTFATTALGTFSSNNSVQPGGIHPVPGDSTGGDGSITGEEVQFNITFTVPIDLPADHYFSSLKSRSSNRAGISSGCLPPGRSGRREPLSLRALRTCRAGREPISRSRLVACWQDIVGGSPGPTFNAVFSLTGRPSPSPPLSH